jgi:hypothetical protein
MRNCLDVPSTAAGRAPAPARAQPHRSRHYRTIFISDTHLGTRGCKAELLADFLTHNECRTLYLVGDIIDGWALKQGWFWSPEHSRVVDLILRKVDRARASSMFRAITMKLPEILRAGVAGSN